MNRNVTGEATAYSGKARPSRSQTGRSLARFSRCQTNLEGCVYHHGVEEPDWWKTSVPEIVRQAFDHYRFVTISCERHRKAPIKAVLLRQSGFSGIGNWMAARFCGEPKSCPRSLREA